MYCHCSHSISVLCVPTAGVIRTTFSKSCVTELTSEVRLHFLAKPLTHEKEKKKSKLFVLLQCVFTVNSTTSAAFVMRGFLQSQVEIELTAQPWFTKGAGGLDASNSVCLTHTAPGLSRSTPRSPAR